MKSRILLTRIVFCMILTFSIKIQAQISTNELPPSFYSTLFSVRFGDIIDLPIPDVAEALREDSIFAGEDIPYRIGLPISVDYNLQNSGVWQTLGDSVRVWRMQLRALGAKALTISYDKFWVPTGAKFFVYNGDKYVCSNSVYYLKKIPNNINVVWECNSSSLALLQNSPSTANVMNGNEKIATFSKNIEAIRVSLSGYCRQETCV